MKAFRHMGIVVSDLDQGLRFYRDLLGLEIVKQMNEEGPFISRISNLTNVKVTTVKMKCKDGNMIELLHYKSHPGTRGSSDPICRIGASHAAFTVDSIDKEYARLKSAGVSFESEPQVSPDGFAKVAFCRDYDNCLIELVEQL